MLLFKIKKFKKIKNRFRAYPIHQVVQTTGSTADVEKFISKKFRIIFANELSAWTSNESEWPTQLTYKVFKDWFDIHVSTMVFDLGKNGIEVV